ncbi:unnamed protein product [Nesidiocoris tenuis]|uniref:Rho-GAP domain-containing protein n=1 Tax=Nesidiocoris tenuis TaxID=355587 RepID=A0A6H5GRV6_9HEMI|nr:unnamed protein product [Nesidiocoris tenuis]CAB0006276.1 unnamed protein product [Nesidiocoris tenuis]
MSEGIYRRSGSSASVNKLMSLMRADAWSVQLSRTEYTEHDVSTVLKRFFRELPDPLFSSALHKFFCNAARTFHNLLGHYCFFFYTNIPSTNSTQNLTFLDAKCSANDKIGMYRTLLDKLPAVNYVTSRRLIGHLHFIAEQSDKNKMPVENLAAIWAPTLMSVEGKRNLEWSKKECEVISDLIAHYKAVFLVDCEEVDREKRIQEVLERVNSSPNLPPPKPSGDLKISVYIGAKSKESVTVVVSKAKHGCWRTMCEAGFQNRIRCPRTLLDRNGPGWRPVPASSPYGEGPGRCAALGLLGQQRLQRQLLPSRFEHDLPRNHAVELRNTLISDGQSLVLPRMISYTGWRPCCLASITIRTLYLKRV